MYRDTVNCLKKQIISALQSVNVPVFNRIVPTTFEDSAYILIQQINSVDKSTCNSTDVEHQVTLLISTKAAKANNNQDLDSISGLVLTALDSYVMDFSSVNAQFLGCRITNSNADKGQIDVLNIYAERTINFTVNLYLLD